MSCFADVVAPAAPPDPTKHVNYTYGMVLGVDEFVQDFAYLVGRDQQLARELIGYGTAFGLRVTYGTERGEPEVRVSAGLCVVPVGQLVRVCKDQCAKLNPWIAARKDDVRKSLGYPASPVEPLRLAVLIRYHECLTDDVPIPGEPCRSEDELMAPSRVRDDFRLDLRVIAADRTNLPPQPEEDVLRLFAAALKAVPLDENPSAAALPPADWEQAVRDWVPGSPIGPPGVSVPAARMADYYRTAFRVWATDLRPKYTRPICDPDEPYLLLAELAVPLTPDLKVPEGAAVQITEDRRPVLLHMRLIQELVFPFGGGPGLPSPLGPGPAGPAAGDTVSIETAFGQSPWAGTADEYSRADHTHGTPPDPIPAHAADKMAHELFGDATGPVGGTVVVGLNKTPLNTAAALAPGQVLTVTVAGGGNEWTPVAFGGDVTGAPDMNTVSKLQGVTVAAAAAKDGEILRCRTVAGVLQWQPVDPATLQAPAAPVVLAGDVVNAPGPPGTNTIAQLQGTPVAAPNPQAGDVLQAVDNLVTGQREWVAGTLNLVGVVHHPSPVVDSGGAKVAALFDIVAAGTFDVTAKAGNILNVAPVGETFNNLSAQVEVQLNPAALRMTFDNFNLPAARRQYVVKLTPMSRLEGKNHSLPFIPYLIGFVGAGPQFPAGFRVGLGNFGGGLSKTQLQVEVSEYRLA